MDATASSGAASGGAGTPGHDDIAARTRARRRHVRRQLYLLNVATGAGLGHLFFTLAIMSVSPRLHELMLEAGTSPDPMPAAAEATQLLMQPAYLVAGLLLSLLGAACGWAMGWVQVRVLDRAGELVRDAEFERNVARRTIDLTVHNQRISELNERLAAAKSDLESQHRALRDTQAKLVESERLAAITETAVSVNHEINGPLMVIEGQSELLLRDLRGGRAVAAGGADVTRQVLHRLETIEGQSLRIAAITRKLASLVEPVSASYLDAEGIRMLDLEQSRADLSRETEPHAVGAGA